MSPLRNIVERAEPVVATGLPGAHRIVVFIIIQTLFSREILGAISSWLFIAQIIGFFTAIGWSSLILVRIPKSKSNEEEVQEIANLLWMSLISLTLSILLIILSGIATNALSSATYISILLTGWTIYQTTRHHLISKRKYRKIIEFDLAIIATTSAGIFVANSTIGIVFAISLPMFFVGIAHSALILIHGKTRKITKIIDPKGLEFGFTNFLSGGISLSIVPLAFHVDSPATAGTIALFISVSAIALLIPRAISLHQISELSRSMSTDCSLKHTVRRMTRQILISNLSTTALNIAVGFYLTKSSETPTPYILLIVFIILITQNFISTQSLVDSNILMSAERSRLMLLINVPLSAVYFSIAAVLYAAKPQFSVIIITATILTITAIRAATTRLLASREIATIKENQNRKIKLHES